MIPVVPAPEPDSFDEKVRIPGKKFLKKHPDMIPTTKQWKHQDHWKHVRFYLHDAYNGVCAYSSHWIPRGESIPNIDHFIPKSYRPDLAYEWNNYRLACPLVNTLKRDFQDVLDPFKIGRDWFFLLFPQLLVKPNSALTMEEQQNVWNTINRLHLNEEETFVHERNFWLEPYCRGDTPFSYLKKNAPFVAYELERQGLVEKIKAMMIYTSEGDF